MTNEAHAPATSDDVSALMAERQRYEDWLAALDARRDSTPKHVYERVRADYETRLQATLDRLSRHKGELEQQVKHLSERLTQLQGQERQRQDERAELELRAHVGELTADGFREAVRSLDEALSGIAGEQVRIQNDLARAKQFLNAAATRPPTPAASAPTPRPAAPHAAAPAPRPAANGTAHPGAPAARQAPANPPAPPRQPESAPQPQNFDDLAFINSLVGAEKERAQAAAAARRPNGSGDDLNIMRDEAATLAESLLSRVNKPAPTDIVRQEPIDALNGPRKPGASEPLAANVTGNSPIVLRPGSEQAPAKTLKCAECGSMNYPTEWYCERCGAELASL
jgi:TolA-binding protein